MLMIPWLNHLVILYMDNSPWFNLNLWDRRVPPALSRPPAVPGPHTTSGPRGAHVGLDTLRGATARSRGW